MPFRDEIKRQHGVNPNRRADPQAKENNHEPEGGRAGERAKGARYRRLSWKSATATELTETHAC
jgi:hypothetical protein